MIDKYMSHRYMSPHCLKIASMRLKFLKMTLRLFFSIQQPVIFQNFKLFLAYRGTQLILEFVSFVITKLNRDFYLGQITFRGFVNVLEAEFVLCCHTGGWKYRPHLSLSFKRNKQFTSEVIWAATYSLNEGFSDPASAVYHEENVRHSTHSCTVTDMPRQQLLTRHLMVAM